MQMPIRRAIASLVQGAMFAGIVALAPGPQAAQAQQAAQDPEVRARAFIDLMAGGQYAQAFESFTPQMKAAMPLERLSATWNSLTAQAGPFQGQVATSVVPRGVLSVVIVTCACGMELGCNPDATRPAGCAMSAKRYAPTSSAIARKRA